MAEGTKIKKVKIGNTTHGIEADDLKARYHLGAFDTVSGNVITRQTGCLLFNKNDTENWAKETYTNITRYRTVKSIYSYGVVSNITNVGDIGDTVPTENGYFINGGKIYLYAKDNDFSNLPTPTIYQYKLTTSYTENVIENQPLNTLDQSGSNWLKDEWKKGLNLYSGTTTDLQNSLQIANLKPNTKYSIYITSDQSYVYSEGHWYVRDRVQSQTILDGILTNQAYTFTTPNDVSNITLYFWGTWKSGTYTCMLNEGDHAYPYQEYNGEIVHKKDINDYQPKYLLSYITNSISGNTSALNNAYSNLKDDSLTAVRIEDGSHRIALGYALSQNYTYSNGYGAFIILNYFDNHAKYLRLENGTWTEKTIANVDDVPDVSGKQDILVSGTNIKTINGTSLLGSGDLVIGGGGGIEEISVADIYLYSSATGTGKITKSGIYLLTNANPVLHISSSKTIYVNTNTMIYVTLNGTYYNWWYINNPNDSANTKELTFGTGGTYTRYTLKDNPHLYMHRITFDGRADGDAGTLNLTIYSTKSTAYDANGVYNYLYNNGYRDTYHMYPAVGYSTEDVTGVNVGAWASGNIVWSRYDNGDGFSDHGWSRYAGTSGYSDTFNDSIYTVF